MPQFLVLFPLLGAVQQIEPALLKDDHALFPIEEESDYIQPNDPGFAVLVAHQRDQNQ